MGNTSMTKLLWSIPLMVISTIAMFISLSFFVEASIPITPMVVNGLEAWCALAGITPSMGIVLVSAAIVIMIYAMSTPRRH